MQAEEWSDLGSLMMTLKQTTLPSFYLTCLWIKYINNDVQRVSRTTSMPKCWLTFKMLLLKMEDCCTVTEHIQGKFKKSKWQKKTMLYSDWNTCRRLLHVKMKAQPGEGRKRWTAFIRASRMERFLAARYDQGVRGRWVNDNSLTLCDCCWQEREGLGRKSKCLIHCLSLHIDQTQQT